MHLAVAALFVLVICGYCERGIAFFWYNTTKPEFANGINNGTSVVGPDKLNQSGISRESSTEHNAEEITTNAGPALPQFFVFVVDYFLNVSSLSHDDPKRAGIDSAASSHLIESPSSAIMQRSLVPSNSSVQTKNSALLKAPGALSPNKLASNSKAESSLVQAKEDEKNEQKRSDTGLLFLIEVVLVVTVSVVVLTLLLKKQSTGPVRPILGGGKMPGLPQYV